MSAPFTKLETPLDRLAVVCRGCLADSGEMKNIYEWGLSDDYFRVTAIETTRTEEISELLCSSCEATLNTCKEFREMCQMSDRKLKTTVKKKKMEQKLLKNVITCILRDQKLVIMITAPKTEAKLHLPCPFHCVENFYKKSDLYNHLKKTHNVSDEFQIELQYYCVESNCAYNISSDKNKWFTGRKFLNQHLNKVHKAKTFYCNDCTLAFSTETEFKRHRKTCNYIYLCEICNLKYNTNEKLMIHLLRKHPDIHKMYKDEKKATKRKSSGKKEQTKKKKANNSDPQEDEADQSIAAEMKYISEDPNNDVETWSLPNVESETALQDDKLTKTIEIEFCDSPKKSSSTQIPEDIRNDVTLPSWQSKNELETKTDEISTQTVFEDLMSLKSQNSEDEIFFSEVVSLSDIQTQTFPLEFGLSRSNKETQSCKNSQTQSPDLSMKETQTCFCHYDSPRPNFRLFDSLSSSPVSINLTSTETQTAEPRHTVKSDVLLSFSSAETQTCFDRSSNDSI